MPEFNEVGQGITTKACLCVGQCNAEGAIHTAQCARNNDRVIPTLIPLFALAFVALFSSLSFGLAGRSLQVCIRSR